MTSIELPDSEIDTTTFALPAPVFLPLRYQPGGLGNWSGHLAFAHDLLGDLRPSLLVELGTHFGESYFGMCQSVVSHGLDCTCYAVDHWHGEEHAGVYGEEVFLEVNEYNQRLYKSFSYLLRHSFDEAVQQFSDGSIDLLHIDGMHTYEAGLHDFESWFPKVRPGGIVLFHDVMVRHGNFGIWKLWEELTQRYPDSFAFHHSWGLGVLRKPGGKGKRHKLLEMLFSASDGMSEQIRRHYVLYAAYIDRMTVKLSPVVPEPAVAESEATNETVLVKLYPFAEQGYSEASALTTNIEPGGWQTAGFELDGAALRGPQRFDPADQACVVEIAKIQITDLVSGQDVLLLQGAAEIRSAISPLGAMFLDHGERCTLICFDDDPQLTLGTKLACTNPVRVTISMKVEIELGAVAKLLIEYSQSVAASYSGLSADIQMMRGELLAAQAARSLLAAELSQMATARASTTHDRQELQAQVEKLQAMFESYKAEKVHERNLMAQALMDEKKRSAEALGQMQTRMESMLASKSWRITKPMRDLTSMLKGRPEKSVE